MGTLRPYTSFFHNFVLVLVNTEINCSDADEGWR